MADELVDIFDEDFNYLQTESKYKAHSEGLWHQIFFCWLVKREKDGNHQALLQLRSQRRLYLRGRLDTSSGGHLKAGETWRDGTREIEEELGLKIPSTSIINFAVGKNINISNGIDNREFCHKCFCETDVDIKDLNFCEKESDGIFSLNIKEGIKLFSHQVSEIEVNGYVRQNNQLIPQKKVVGINDFMPYPSSEFLNVFEIIETFLDQNIAPLSPSYHENIIEIWEASVKASHLFLKPEEIDFYRPLVLKYTLPQLQIFGAFTDKQELGGFICIRDNKIEMLFISPQFIGQGLGTKLLNHAITKHHCTKVDVNEENPNALKFYQNKKFKIISRDELDDSGKPHPILHMSL